MTAGADPASQVRAAGERGQHGACLALFVFVTLIATDYSFLTDDATLQWLLNDYTESLVPLAAVLLLPSVRATARAAFGPLRWPAEPPRYLTLFLVLAACVAFDFANSNVLRPYLFEVLPDIRTDHYPKVEDAALAWFDLTFGLALTAVSEELGARVIMARVLRWFTTSATIIVVVSAVVFGALHWTHGIANAISATISGVVYMALYLKTGSILPSMAVHYATNLVRFYPWYFG